MSDTSQGEGWWQASDGKWYPPSAVSADDLPAPPVSGYGPPPPGPASPGYGKWRRRWRRYLWIVPVVIVVFVFVGAVISGGYRPRDWFDEANDANTCAEITTLITDYIGSYDDNGLRGSGTHGYLTRRHAELCN